VYFIYFIRSGNVGRPIKIGISNNVKKRMATMQTGSPDDLYLIGVIPSESRKQALSVEKWLHCRYEKHHIRGEWFSGSIKLKKGVNRVELEKHNIIWSRVWEHNKNTFWKLDNYGYDIKKIKREACS